MDTIEVIVETPKGSQFKYKYDPKKEWFTVHKALPVGLIFPYDFGFIPGTKGDDGDPLDVLIMSEFSFIQGSMLECKVIGSMKAEQTDKEETIRNDRIFVYPDLKGFYPVYNSMEDIQKEKLKEIESFFIYYNSIQDKNFKPLGILGAKETLKIINQQRSS
jgi:inorganic pyrophosphatase